jgi:ribulose-5-phosphate 4-epimerase/fuculose-1-phosphate aldolase
MLMHDQIEKYTQKLLRDGTAVPESIRFYRLDDVVTAGKQDEWLPMFTEIFKELNITALLFAKMSLPFADLLVARADAETDKLIPNDSETRGFLHDIPFIRESAWAGKSKSELGDMIIRCLQGRKTVIIQNLGVVATGGVTVEQAFIGFSTIFHTTFVKYLLDVLQDGFKVEQEKMHFEDFKKSWLKQPDLSDLVFDTGLHEAGDRGQGAGRIVDEICKVGRYTVEKGYVDSFFGNISYFDGTTIFISQTASSLDELAGHIDPVPLDNSSTAGLSASSELPAHRGIYLSTNYQTILHGHPKFSVIMSMFCEEENCEIKDCNRLCNRKRSVCNVPIVSGETGAGGLAKSVPPAIKESGVCIAFGHGIFSAGEKNFQDAFMKMTKTEDNCRETYFELLGKKCNV